MRLALSILLVLLISACLMAKDPSEKTTPACPPESYCYRQGLDEKAQGECLMDMAIRCARGQLCGKILLKDIEYTCRIRLGEYDPLICAHINDTSLKVDCYTNGATMSGDAQLCEKISSLYDRTMCLSQLAQKLGKRSLCDRIDNLKFREFCFAVADRELRICSNIIDDDLRDKCVQMTAEASIKAKMRQT